MCEKEKGTQNIYIKFLEKERHKVDINKKLSNGVTFY
jgi:hypothetical protein